MTTSDPVSIQWQLVKTGILSGLESFTDRGEHWQGKVTDPASARLLLEALNIDAGKDKYLYLKIAAGKARSIQVAFAGDGKYTLIRSFRGSLPAGEGPMVMQFDLRQFPLWKGKVTCLWLNLEGGEAGDTVQFYGVGSASQAVDPQDGSRLAPVTAQLYVWAMTDRDWPQGKPAVSYWSPNGVWTNECDEPWQTSFPQPEYWAACRVLKTASAVLNVVEFDLGRPEVLKSLTLSTIGTEPALGLVAVSAEFA